MISQYITGPIEETAVIEDKWGHGIKVRIRPDTSEPYQDWLRRNDLDFGEAVAGVQARSVAIPAGRGRKDRARQERKNKAELARLSVNESFAPGIAQKLIVAVEEWPEERLGKMPSGPEDYLRIMTKPFICGDGRHEGVAYAYREVSEGRPEVCWSLTKFQDTDDPDSWTLIPHGGKELHHAMLNWFATEVASQDNFVANGQPTGDQDPLGSGAGGGSESSEGSSLTVANKSRSE